MRIAGTKKWWNPARPAYTIILSHRICPWLFRWFRDRFSKPDPRIYVTWRFRCSLSLGLLFHRLWPGVHTFSGQHYFLWGAWRKEACGMVKEQRRRIEDQRQRTHEREDQRRQAAEERRLDELEDQRGMIEEQREQVYDREEEHRQAAEERRQAGEQRRLDKIEDQRGRVEEQRRRARGQR